MSSAPPSSSARRHSTERSASGKQSVRYPTSARRFFAPSSSKRRAMLLDEIVVDVKSIPIGFRRLDDCARIFAAGVGYREVHGNRWLHHYSVRIADDLHDRPRQRLHIWIRRVHDCELERIEN